MTAFPTRTDFRIVTVSFSIPLSPVVIFSRYLRVEFVLIVVIFLIYIGICI